MALRTWLLRSLPALSATAAAAAGACGSSFSSTTTGYSTALCEQVYVAVRCCRGTIADSYSCSNAAAGTRISAHLHAAVTSTEYNSSNLVGSHNSTVVAQGQASPAKQEEEAAGFLQRAKDAVLNGEDLQRWQSVASSIQDCMQHVGPWGLGDFAFGL